MKNVKIVVCNITSIFVAIMIMNCQTIYAKRSTEISLDIAQENIAGQTIVAQQPTFQFQFHNEPLINIINQVAAAKDINIILPKQPLDAKVTFALEQPVTIDRAWDLLHTLLDVAGYTIKLQESLFTVVPITGDISKEPMPTFIGTAVDELPNTDQWIRYIYYFANLQVSDAQDSELNKIVDTLLPIGSKRLVDPLTNAVIMVSKSTDIKAAMDIVSQLDKAGFQEKMEIIPLHHTQARMIADLFKQQILPEETPGQSPNRFRLDARKPSDAYFSPHTRIIAEERKNALIVLGRAQAVDRLKDFITNYIDIELDSGKSILHIYKLQYLDARQAEAVLKKVVESAQSGGTEQSRAAQGAATPGGPQRFFEEVIIQADTPEGVEEAGFQGFFGYQQSGDANKTIKYQYAGGNKLVVAARNSDWNVIKKLIEEIDQPQPQVLIEVLIADITLDDQRQLGAQTRNPAKINMPSDLNIQSAQLANPLVNDITNPTSIKTDLLRNITPQDVPALKENQDSIAALATPGSSIIEFNDSNGKTWSLLQILQSFGQTKIISHPHVISTSNKEALISLGEERLVVGPADVGNTAANVKNEKITAKLSVKILPRISGGVGGTVNLSVQIDIQEFLGPLNDERIMRLVQTQANVKDGSILALGGLIRTEDNVGKKGLPVIERIPILGWLFKNRTGETIKTNLTVFIRPTIIMPRLRRGVNQYTKDYLEVAKSYAQEGDLFDGLQEPITRFFFKTGSCANDIINEFIKKDEYQRIESPQEEAPTAYQRRKLKKAQQSATKTKEKKSRALKDMIASDDNPLLTAGRIKRKDRARS